MVSNELDEFMEMLKESMLNAKEQAELQLLVKNRPEIYREKVEAQELGIDGIMKTTDGFRQNGKPAPQHSIDAALRRADERMLRESPLLQERKLKFSGGNLIPDKAAYKKEAKS